MNIIVAGAGKIGFTLTQYLAREGHDVTVIDRDPERITLVNTTLDAISIAWRGRTRRICSSPPPTPTRPTSCAA